MIFLSDDWITAMDAAARRVVVGEPLVVEQVVHEVPGRGGVRYHLAFAPEGGRVGAGPAERYDVRLTTDYATACALARGETNAQEALARGRLRLGGDPNALVARADSVAALADVFASVRERTEYPA